MNNLATLVTILRVNTCTAINRIIFYFRKLPFIGKILPESAYGFGDIKSFVSVISNLSRALLKFLFVGLYLICFFLPAILLLKDTVLENKNLEFAVLVNLFLGMNLIAGAIQKNTVTVTDEEKYLFIKLMRMPARQYSIAKFWMAHLGNALSFGILLPALAFFFDYSSGKALLLSFFLLSSHCFIDAFDLFVINRIKNTKPYLNIHKTFGTLLGIAVAYLPLFFMEKGHFGRKWVIGVTEFLTSFWGFLLFLILFVISCLIITRFRGYQSVFEKTFRMDQLLAVSGKSAQQMRFSDVSLKEEDFSKNQERAVGLERKKGYAYLNSLFFLRHRRMMVRPLLVRLGIIGAAFLIGLVSCLFFPAAKDGIEYFFRSSLVLPIFVFLMYLLSMGERICRAMFKNCDISLLRYPFYRRKEILLKNFQIRLFSIVRLNGILALAICVGTALLSFLTEMNWAVSDQLLFCLTILLLSVFFSVHYLFLYYVFQPYTTELGVKNPFFNILNTAVYIACYLCLQIDTVPSSFVWIVLTATTLYIIIALVLVYRFAPKTFRVK